MTRPPARRRSQHRIVAAIAGLFGLLTIIAAGAVLSGTGRAAAGAVVPFVLWANLALGFAYIVGAALLWRQSPRARGVALAIAAATALAGVAFAVTAMTGTPVETRTAGALIFRTLFWLGVAAVAPGRRG